MRFQGDLKFGHSLLREAEERLRDALLPHVPRQLETYHLTLMTVAWSLLILAFSFLARTNILWLWMVSLMVALQYITDLLDGAIGRKRNTGLVKWGFYMDHFLDYLFLCSILIGYAMLLDRHHRFQVFFVIAMFGGFMVNSFLSFAATNQFRISYLGIGPTEVRLIFVLVNTLIVCCGTGIVVVALPYVVALSTFGLFVTVFQTQKTLWRIDMEAKRKISDDG